MNQVFKTTNMKALLLASAGFCAAIPAQAQNIAVEEIVVTARQRSELLSDIPIAITAFTAANIERLNINTIEDIAKFTPGLTVSKRNQPNGTKLSLRGLDVRSGRSPVALRVDGIDLTTESVFQSGIGYLGNQRLMDLERIEVVKGAQVALYGRAAFGGAINYITKRPNLEEMTARFTLDGNLEDEQEITAGFSGPVIENKLAVGFNASYYRDGGSHTNILSGSKLGKAKGTGVAASFVAKPNDDFTAYGRVEYTHDEANQPAGIIVAPQTTITFDAETAAVVNGSSALLFRGMIPDQSPDDLAISLSPFTLEDYPGSDKESLVASLIMDYEFDGFTFSSLTGWLDQETENYQQNNFSAHPFVDENGVPNVSGGLVPASYTAQEYNALTTSRIFNQELRLQSNSEDSRLQWQVGGLYWEEETDQAQDQSTLLPLIPTPTEVFLDYFRRETGDRQRRLGRDTYHWSVYAWAEYEVTDQLSVSAEIRHNDENADYFTRDTVYVSLVFPGGDIVNVSTRPDPADQPIVRVSQSFTTPKLSLTYKPTEDTTLYASVAKSVKPAGHSTGSTSFTPFNRFETEKLWSYEVGAKGTFLDGNLNLNGAFFYMDYTNQQVPTTIFDEDSNLPRGAIENAGESRRLGFELDGVFRVSDNFTLSGAYTYLGTKFTQFELLTSATISAGEGGGCVRFDTFPNGQQACVIDYSGNEAGKVPKHSFSVNGNFTAPLTDTLDWFAETNIRFTDDRYLAFTNNALAPEFWRVDLRAGVTSENMQAMFYVNNLLDSGRATDIDTYFDYRTSTFSPAPLVFLPDPITVGFRMAYSL